MCSPTASSRCCASSPCCAISRTRPTAAAARSIGGWRSFPGRATPACCALPSTSASVPGSSAARRSTSRRCPSAFATTCPTGSLQPLEARLGAEFWPWVTAIDTPAPLDLRVNALKADRDEILGSAARGRHRGRADAVLAARLARRRQAGTAKARHLRARPGRSAGRRQPAPGPDHRCEARRDGGRLLRRCRRQDARPRRADAKYRSPVRVRHLRSPACGAEAASGAQRPRQCSPGADRARARRSRQAPGRQGRPCPRRRAVQRHGHAAAPPRPQVAPVSRGRRGPGAEPARHPGGRGSGW